MHFSPQGGSPSFNTNSTNCLRCASSCLVVGTGEEGGGGFRYAEMRCKRKNCGG